MSSSNAELWGSLDSELGSLLDHFTSLVRASHVQTEDDSHGGISSTGAREKRAPGDMLQVWVEKIIHSGHTSLQILSQLKKGAVTSDFDLLLNHVRASRRELEGNLAEGERRVSDLKRELRQLEGQRRSLNQPAAMES